MNGSRLAFIAAFGALVSATTGAAAGDDDPLRIITNPEIDPIGPRGASMLMTGFEASDGWSLGLADDTAPAGWGVLGGSNSPSISNLNPWTGAQHLHIEKASGVGSGADIGVVSPELAMPDDDVEMFTFKLGVFISEKGGADYDVFLQNPSASSAPAARVKFDFSGRILIVDDFAFMDTGAEWDPGEWKELRVEIDYTGSNSVANYYYGGALIWTDANRVGLSEYATQFAIVSDNNNDDDYADFDNVMMTIPAPATVTPALLALGAIARRRRR